MKSGGSPTATRTRFIDGTLRCSFCGKRRDQCEKLIAGPGGYICNNCVALCDDILSGATRPRRPWRRRRC